MGAWGSGIKSIQRGTIGPNTTAAISAVDVTKTFLNYLGVNDESATGSAMARIVLTNSTTITSTGGDGGDATSYEVIEFY